MTTPAFTDQQVRALVAALRVRPVELHPDAWGASFVIEQLYRERGSLIATLERVRHAVDVVARDVQIPAAGLQVLRDALDEVAW